MFNESRFNDFRFDDGPSATGVSFTSVAGWWSAATAGPAAFAPWGYSSVIVGPATGPFAFGLYAVGTN